MSTVEESVRSVTKRNKLSSRCGTSEPTDWSSSTTPTSDTRDPVQVVPTADTSRFSSASLRTQDPLGPPSRRFDNLDSTARQATPDQVDFFFKVMLLGDSGVGKTCLLTRFRDGRFLSGNYITTVGIDFRNKIVTVDETRVKLQIWDTAGQERFRSVTHAYYRDAHGTFAIIIIVLVIVIVLFRRKFISFPLWWSQSKQKITPSCLSPLSINIAHLLLLSALLLLYDVTNKTSFDNIRAWLSEIREHANEDVVIMLLGNKSDCGQERVVKKEDGERLAQEYKVPFMETSAKTGLNVELAFLAVARELKARKSSDPDDTKFNVQDYVRQQSKRNSCFNSNCLTT
ncbi:ras-related protein Rab-37-like isoform X3 [Vespula squamosa]|uniref:Ras-related protein Rab-37-like isoform X3 n=1 Tax=Vespula squamosa TaxID=30214 RepID=A0ABD2A8M8_VESSQ